MAINNLREQISGNQFLDFLVWMTDIYSVMKKESRFIFEIYCVFSLLRWKILCALKYGQNKYPETFFSIFLFEFDMDRNNLTDTIVSIIMELFMVEKK